MAGSLDHRVGGDGESASVNRARLIFSLESLKHSRSMIPTETLFRCSRREACTCCPFVISACRRTYGPSAAYTEVTEKLTSSGGCVSMSCRGRLLWFALSKRKTP
jgi:hypothetical protein